MLETRGADTLTPGQHRMGLYHQALLWCVQRTYAGETTQRSTRTVNITIFVKDYKVDKKKPLPAIGNWKRPCQVGAGDGTDLPNQLYAKLG